MTDFEAVLIDVWRQVLIEDKSSVTIERRNYPVRRTTRRKLRQVDFAFDGEKLRGLEQNPNTGSRWGQLAREGRKVMQFLSQGRYVANIVDGELRMYGRKPTGRRS